MKLLTKILMAMQLLATGAVWGDSCDSNNPDNLPNPAYRRTIVIAAFLPSPLPFIDPGHQGMLNRFPGLYQQSDVTKLNTDALNFFYETHGVDFRTETNGANIIPTPDGFGLVVLDAVTHAPIAAWYPITFGQDLQDAMIVDTSHRNWEVTHYWFYYQPAEGVSFLSPYTVPQGFTQAGAQAQPGDILIYGNVNLLANGTDLTKDVNRAEFVAKTDQLIKRNFNENGIAQFHNYLSVGRSGTGRYSAPGMVKIDPNDPSAPQLLYCPVITFDCPATALSTDAAG